MLDSCRLWLWMQKPHGPRREEWVPYRHGHPRARRCSVSQAQPAKPQLLEIRESVTPCGESQLPSLTSGRAPRVPDCDVGQECWGRPRLPSVDRSGRSAGPVGFLPCPSLARSGQWLSPSSL